MCINCFGGTETLVAGGVGAAGIAARARIGLKMLLGRTTVEDRHREALERYDTNCAFIASLGHDPADVLGPPPDPPGRQDPGSPVSAPRSLRMAEA